MARLARGEIWLVKLDPTVGHEIQKTRPCVILQNDILNTHSELTVVLPITSQKIERIFPGQVFIAGTKNTGIKDSKVICQQIRSVDKKRLARRLGVLTKGNISDIETQLQIVLGMY